MQTILEVGGSNPSKSMSRSHSTIDRSKRSLPCRKQNNADCEFSRACSRLPYRMVIQDNEK